MISQSLLQRESFNGDDQPPGLTALRKAPHLYPLPRGEGKRHLPFVHHSKSKTRVFLSPTP